MAVEKRACTIDGCHRLHEARGLCNMHYLRWWHHGTTVDPPTLPRVCSIEGCTKLRKKRGWCPMHYRRWHRYGDPETEPQWTATPVGGPCVGCGSPNLMPGSRRFCSANCKARVYRLVRQGRPIRFASACVLCGDAMDMLATNATGRKRRDDARLCESCRRSKSHRHKASFRVIARRDGERCQLCQEPVDLTLRFPDPRSPSVDHVIARAHGGSDDLTNLQLAHLRCNHLKSARSGWTLV